MNAFTSRLVILVAFALLCTHVSAQDTLVAPLWKKKLNFAMNFNQATFSTNWKAGGSNSIGLNSLFNYSLNYKNGRDTWDNAIDCAFGFTKLDNDAARKAIDRLYLDTKYGHDINNDWGLFTSFTFLSQFTRGYNYNDDDTRDLISDFAAPAYMTLALGAEYSPVPYFRLRIAPVAPRLTVVKDPQRFTKTVSEKPYGVDTTKTTRFEGFAGLIQAEFDKEIFKNVNFKWRYMMFANYETLSPETIDHRLDLNIIAKVAKYVNVSIGGVLIYDYDQDHTVQYSQVFSLGFIYSFQNYEDPPPAP
jgi:hypothetical protein